MSGINDPASIAPLEPDDPPADDSGVEEVVDDASSTQSISSSIFQYRVENGRTYTAFGSGEYTLPNDEKEKERLVDIMHHLWKLLNDGMLFRSPQEHLKRILDVGTGTGIWAMDVADEHPEAEVIGVDLSPIQPSFIPPNCKFVIDDLERQWLFKQRFELIFMRSMIASFEDWPWIFNQAFKNLESGGYIEVHDHEYPLATDDDTIRGTHILEWSQLMVEAAVKLGRSITIARNFKSMLENAGFVDVVEIKQKTPMGRWPKDPRHKELGEWSRHMLLTDIEGISMGLLTKERTAEAVRVLLAEVRKDLFNPNIHGYWYTYMVYAKKPEDTAT